MIVGSPIGRSLTQNLTKYDIAALEFVSIVIGKTKGKAISIAQLSAGKFFACQEQKKISSAKYKEMQDLCRALCMPIDYHAF